MLPADLPLLLRQLVERTLSPPAAEFAVHVTGGGGGGGETSVHLLWYSAPTPHAAAVAGRDFSLLASTNPDSAHVSGSGQREVSPPAAYVAVEWGGGSVGTVAAPGGLVGCMAATVGREGGRDVTAPSLPLPPPQISGYGPVYKCYFYCSPHNINISRVYKENLSFPLKSKETDF